MEQEECCNWTPASAMCLQRMRFQMCSCARVQEPHTCLSHGQHSQLRAHQAEQRHRQALIAIVKKPLVQQRQQRIEDGAVGLEDLVNERDLCCRQVAVQLAHILVIFQP